MIKNSSFGVFFLDQPDSVTEKTSGFSGWASVAGGDSFRIRSVSDLDGDLIWLSNISKGDLWRSSLVKNGNIKHSDYLRENVFDLAIELGVNIGNGSECVQVLSLLFSNIMTLHRGVVKTDFLSSDLVGDFISNTNDRGISIHVDEALNRSYQEVLVTKRKRDTNSFVLKLKRPPYDHAKRVISTIYPTKDFLFLNKEGVDDQIEGVLSSGASFLAKVSIKGYKDLALGFNGIEHLLAFGDNYSDFGRARDREWITDIEYFYFSKFLNLCIDAMFVFNEGATISHDMGLEVNSLGPLSDYSYTLGLYYENMYLGLSSKTINVETRKAIVTPRACWLSAMDRFLCLSSAIIMEASGVPVLSYGLGSVNVEVNADTLPVALNIAQQAGLIIPSRYINQALL